MSNKKLYINPNFVKMSENEMVVTKPVLHINPNFYPQLVKNDIHINSNVLNTRIYVNPRFVTQTPMPITESAQVYNAHQASSEKLTTILNDNNSQKTNTSFPSASISKSRYKFIRNKEIPTVNKTSAPNVQTKSTIVINKYKIASVKEYMRNIEQSNPTKPLTINDINFRQNKVKNSKLNVNKYKFVKANSLIKSKTIENKLISEPKTYLQSKDKLKLVSIENSIKIRRKLNNNILLIQKVARSKRQSIGKLKKNNIPCPLFKKYGKCIRKERGNCKFVHDRKHVTICKRFLLGACHYNNCLLSHDLTAKKMPTCKFYLKGLCTRDNCPYVHEKLNEKTSICVDFLKGYCEKGDKCSKRHINVCPRFTITGKCLLPKCPYPHKLRKPQKFIYGNESKDKDNEKKRELIKSSIVVNHMSTSTNEIVKENHYYVDAKKEKKQEPIKKSVAENHKSTNETIKENRYYIDEVRENVLPENAVIRPSRCKLGQLPSYIKL